MTVAPGQFVGPYENLAPLGAGGMGEVYRARDTRLDRDVALKFLPALLAADADRLSRFEREAKALAALNHPHIAQIHAIETTGSVHAIVIGIHEMDRRTRLRLTSGILPGSGHSAKDGRRARPSSGGSFHHQEAFVAGRMPQ